MYVNNGHLEVCRKTLDPDPRVKKQNKISGTSRQKNLEFYYFDFFMFLSLKIMETYLPSKRNRQKNLGKKKVLLPSWSLTKIAGSESGSVSQRYGTTNLDP